MPFVVLYREGHRYGEPTSPQRLHHIELKVQVIGIKECGPLALTTQDEPLNLATWALMPSDIDKPGLIRKA
jgi:hypothetical protein